MTMRRLILPLLSTQPGTSLPARTPGTVHSTDWAVLNFAATYKGRGRMELPLDVVARLGQFLDEPKDRLCLGLACKRVWGAMEGQILPRGYRQSAAKKAWEMYKHVKRHPPYRITYTFTFKWNIHDAGVDSFCFMIRNEGVRVCGHVSRMRGGDWRRCTDARVLSQDNVVHAFKEVVLPVLERVVFTASHDYKKKHIDMIYMHES